MTEDEARRIVAKAARLGVKCVAREVGNYWVVECEKPKVVLSDYTLADWMFTPHTDPLK